MTEQRSVIPGHEKSDADVSPIRWIVLGFVVIVAAISLGVWWIYGYYRTEDADRDVRRSYIGPVSVIPPEPRLQVDPRMDFERFRQSEENILNNYGWASREQGKVRIPIRRAMELEAEKRQ